MEMKDRKLPGRGKLVDNGHVTNRSITPASPGVRYESGEVNLWLSADEMEQLAFIAKHERRGEPVDIAETVFRRGIQASLESYKGKPMVKGLRLMWRAPVAGSVGFEVE